MRDLKSIVDFATSIPPQVATTTQTGTGVDLRGYEAASLHLNVGALTDGTHTPTLEESDDNLSFGAVAAADMLGTLAACVANTNQRIGYRGVKRYIRAVMTVGGGPGTGMAYSASIVRGYSAQKPLA